MNFLFFSVILRAIQNFSQALVDNFSRSNFDYQVRLAQMKVDIAFYLCLLFTVNPYSRN